jgi:hypothetical protein
MVKMARRKSTSKSTGLGMGLDALIKSKTRAEPKEETDITEDVKSEKDISKENLEGIEDLEKSKSEQKPVKKPKEAKKSKKTKSSKSQDSSNSTRRTDDFKKDSSQKPSRINESDNKTLGSTEVDRITLVTDDVKKNPRITLWSSRSAAVLRYLKKTQPEFSISKEASKLIEDAVKEKYPEIWDLFDDL